MNATTRKFRSPKLYAAVAGAALATAAVIGLSVSAANASSPDTGNTTDTSVSSQAPKVTEIGVSSQTITSSSEFIGKLPEGAPTSGSSSATAVPATK